MRRNMNIIFCGDPIHGILPYAIRKEKEEAENLVDSMRSKSLMAFSLPVQQDHKNNEGQTFLLSGTIINGFDLHGPFHDMEEAQEFAQKFDEAWEVFNLDDFDMN